MNLDKWHRKHLLTHASTMEAFNKFIYVCQLRKTFVNGKLTSLSLSHSLDLNFLVHKNYFSLIMRFDGNRKIVISINVTRNKGLTFNGNIYGLAERKINFEKSSMLTACQ